MPKGKVYIGRIKKLVDRTSTNKPNLAYVEPIIESTDGRDRWAGPIKNPESVFPDRGRLFWFNAPVEAIKESYWQFAADDQPTYDGHEKPEAYQVVHATHPLEVLDLRIWGKEAIVRRLVNAEGIPLARSPLWPRVLFWIEDEHWIGPVHLAEENVGRWKIDTNDPTRLECHRPPKDGYSVVNIDGPRILISPDADLGPIIGYRNWASDENFALGVLKRIRKFDSTALKVTNRVFKKYLKDLKDAGLTKDTPMHELARSERVIEFRETVESNKALLEEATWVLLNSEAVQQELSKKKKDLYKVLRKEQEEQVLNELTAKFDELKTANKNIEESTAKVGRLTEEIELLNQELENRVAAFEDELRDRLAQLLNVPEKAFAEIAIIRAALPKAEEPVSDHHSQKIIVHGQRGPSDVPDQVCILTKLEELNRIRNEHLRCRHIHSALLGNDLHLAFLSGSVPVLVGHQAYDILEAYADSVTGGKLLWVPISGTTYEPNDLLGKLDSTTRRFVPHPSGLLDVLLEAESSSELVLVVLDGFNRAPVETYLLPLLDARHDAVTGKKNLRRIPLIAPGTTTRNDPYASVGRVSWPANALLALLPVEGSVTLPVPDFLWRHAVLLDCDGYLDCYLKVSDHKEKMIGLARVDSDAWRSWSSELQKIDISPVREVLARLDRQMSRTLKASSCMASSIYAAALLLGHGTDRALGLASKLALLPLLSDADIKSIQDSQVLQLGEAGLATIERIRKLFR